MERVGVQLHSSVNYFISNKKFHFRPKIKFVDGKKKSTYFCHKKSSWLYGMVKIITDFEYDVSVNLLPNHSLVIYGGHFF